MSSNTAVGAAAVSQPRGRSETLKLAGPTWTVQVTPNAGGLARQGLSPPFWLVLVAGATTSVAASLGAHLLARHQMTLSQALKQSEAAAQERALASTVFDASDQAILVTDRNGRILMANQAFTQLTGYRLSEIQARRPNLL